MAMQFDIGPYDPCPCGSGKKYKFCCAEKAKANRHGKFPVGTVAYYGPDDQTVTKVAAIVFLREDGEPIVERWTGPDMADDPNVAAEIKQFFARHGVKNVEVIDEVVGCPHEEGKDFPVGQECPVCFFWRGKQGVGEDSDDDLADMDDEQDDDEFDREIKVIDEDEDEEDNPDDGEAAIDRIDAIAGDTEDRGQAVDRILAYLQANLQFPCEVTGIEDFRWEEPYDLGGLYPKDYKILKKTQPSYTDRYRLLSLTHEGFSEWMMFWDEDISAAVQRISDGKDFVLGLAELEPTDKQSPNYRLLRDYAIWFVNTR